MTNSKLYLKSWHHTESRKSFSLALLHLAVVARGLAIEQYEVQTARLNWEIPK
jgi:hypothetical protein